MTRERGQDDRDFDQTYLSEKNHGAKLHRDYTAHFYRWCFIERWTRLFNKNNACRILEVGCGPERPLPMILTKTKASRVDYYLGVDLNKAKRKGKIKWEHYLEDFNFVERWEELQAEHKGDDRFHLAVHLEVIEHMQPEHGDELLRGCYELLQPGGYLLMSTPCYNGKWQAANHIHEYEIPELQQKIEDAGFIVEQRFGTFANVPSLKRECEKDPARKQLWDELSEYYSYDALSCIFAPLFPDEARNNLWVCKKPEDAE